MTINMFRFVLFNFEIAPLSVIVKYMLELSPSTFCMVGEHVTVLGDGTVLYRQCARVGNVYDWTSSLRLCLFLQYLYIVIIKGTGFFIGMEISHKLEGFCFYCCSFNTVLFLSKQVVTHTGWSLNLGGDPVALLWIICSIWSRNRQLSSSSAKASTRWCNS